MTPYYDEDGITIYHGDCADVIPLLDPADVGLVLTDPPYGMRYEPLRGSNGSKRWRSGVDGDASRFDPQPLLRFDRLVLFGANWFADRLPHSGGWIVWDKTPEHIKAGFAYSHAELAWSNVGSSINKFNFQWGGEARGGEPNLHPTQKPVALMRWILDKWTQPGDLIFDPYMGSGPVAQACHEMGRRYVGVELVEEYCKVAVDRLSQGVLSFD